MSKSNHGRAASDIELNYNGLRMRCAPGTHEAVAEMALGYAADRSANVLDIASGSGAFLARLAEAGYQRFSAVELDVPKFEFRGCVPKAVDLNGPFVDRFTDRFDLITAIEIVEHLDSPRHFLRELRQLLTDDGVLILSTPNVANWRGRLKFVATGELRYFDRGQYEFNHHISPLTDTMMRMLLVEIGLEVIDHTTAGVFPHGLIGRSIDAVARTLRGPAAVNEVNVYGCRRSTPATSLPGDWTHD